MWCLCITALTSSNNHVICLLGRMSPRVSWSHSFLFYYLRDAVSGILDCAKIADGFQIAEGLWNHWPVAPPLHRFTLHCIMVYGGPISFSNALKLLWYGRVSSLLQSVWAWCVGAILPIASGLPKIQHPVAITWIANIEVLIAGGLRQTERALFGDCGAQRGLQRTQEHRSGPALQSGLRPDGQPLG